MPLHRQIPKHSVLAATAIASVLLGGSAQSGSVVLHVDDDAPLGGNGLSWDTAFTFLQDALFEAAGDPTITEIRVAQGTYKPDRDEANPDGTNDRGATFQLINSVALMGGYAGIGAEDPNARNTELYETILSGAIGDLRDSQDNSVHVMKGEDLSSDTILDGLTVTQGFA